MANLMVNLMFKDGIHISGMEPDKYLVRLSDSIKNN